MFPACSISGSERTTFVGSCYEFTCIKEGLSRAVYVQLNDLWKGNIFHKI